MNRTMKHLANILVAALAAGALIQLYCVHAQLKYNCDALAWQMRNENDMLKSTVATSFRRTHQEAQKIASLEAQLKTLTAGTSRSN